MLSAGGEVDVRRLDEHKQDTHGTGKVRLAKNLRVK